MKDYFSEEIEGKKPDYYQQEIAPQYGAIMTPQTMAREQRQRYLQSGRMAGDIGQTIGGLGGFALGGAVGHPYVGGAVGGTAGRGAGITLQEALRQIGQDVRGRDIGGLLQKGGEIMQGPARFIPQTIQRAPQEKRQQIFGETATAAGTEAIAGPIGAGLNFAGKGMLKGLLTARVAERGFERGFQKVLDPEFYQNRVPKMIAEKTSQFFNRLTDVTGKSVQRIINSKYKNVSASTMGIKEEIANILPSGIVISDLATTSNAQKKMLAQITQEVMNIDKSTAVILPKGKKITEALVRTQFAIPRQKITYPQLWELRKKIDKFINAYNWSDEAYSYLSKLRRTLNKPLATGGKDISKAFGSYAFVKEGEYDLGKNFIARKGPGGEIYASPAERFASEIMSSKKDDLIRRLQALDKLNHSQDKVIEDFLDYAASEALDKKIGFGVFQEALVGMLGGRKRIAQVGAVGQTPGFIGTRMMAGRGAPILGTRLFFPQENE